MRSGQRLIDLRFIADAETLEQFKILRMELSVNHNFAIPTAVVWYYSARQQAAGQGFPSTGNGLNEEHIPPVVVCTYDFSG